MSYENNNFVCGTENKQGLKLTYSYDKNNDCSYIEFLPEKHHQSYDGVFHGGLQSAIMDSAMVHVLKVKKITAVTAKMELRFKDTVNDNSPIRIEAKVSDNELSKGFYRVTSCLFQNSKLKTKCEAIFKKTDQVN